MGRRRAAAGWPAPEGIVAADLWFVASLAAYFAAHAGLRTVLGGALEVDEAEMLLLAQGWHLGYGPQLPLYNWLQVLAFCLFGQTALALAGLKNAVLFAALAGFYGGLRVVVPRVQALAATLSFALMPNIFWEFQRASTHSIVLLAALTACIALVLVAIARGGWRVHLALGLALGLGGLAKFNFWLMPLALFLAGLSLPWVRARLEPDRLAAAVAVAALIVALPYGWIATHPDLALASSAKLYRPDTGLPPFVEGAGKVAIGTVLGLLPVALAWLAFRPWRRAADQTGPAPQVGGLLLRAAVIGLVLTLIVVLAANVSEVQGRWLVPVFCLAGPGAMILATSAASRRAMAVYCGVCAGVGLLTLGGMAELRLNGDATGGLDFAPLVARVSAEGEGATVLANYHIGGNLAFLVPGLEVLPPLPRAGGAPPPARLMILTTGGKDAAPLSEILGRGFAAPASLHVTASGTETLRYRDAPDASFAVDWLVVETTP